MTAPHAPVARGSVLAGAATLLSRLAGLVRERLFAHYFGTSAVSDALGAALRVPLLVQSALGDQPIAAALVPVHAPLLATDAKSSAGAASLARAVGLRLAVLAVTIGVLGIVAAPALVTLLAGGFEEEKRLLTIRLVRILLVSAMLLIMSSWCAAVLNSHRRFFLPYVVPSFSALGAAAALVIYGRRVDVASLAEAAAWGLVAGAALQFAVQLIAVWPHIRGNRSSATDGVDHRPVWRGLASTSTRGLVARLGTWVDTAIAAQLTTGAVAALSYAQLLNSLPMSLFALSISTTTFPALSRLTGATAPPEDVRRLFDLAVRRTAFLIVPSAMAFLALGDVIVGAVYRTGAFTTADVRYVWSVLAGSSVGLLASTLVGLYATACFALRQQQVPLRAGVVRLVVRGALGLALALGLPSLFGLDRRWGVVGVAVASGASGWVELWLLRRVVERTMTIRRPADTGLGVLWTASFAAAIVARAAVFAWGAAAPIALAAIALPVFAAVYLGTSVALGHPDARELVARAARVLTPRRTG